MSISKQWVSDQSKQRSQDGYQPDETITQKGDTKINQGLFLQHLNFDHNKHRNTPKTHDNRYYINLRNDFGHKVNTLKSYISLIIYLQ